MSDKITVLSIHNISCKEAKKKIKQYIQEGKQVKEVTLDEEFINKHPKLNIKTISELFKK